MDDLTRALIFLGCGVLGTIIVVMKYKLYVPIIRFLASFEERKD